MQGRGVFMQTRVLMQSPVNDTFVPWKWHEEAKGIHVVRKR
jgi:hypothetical protein